VGVGVCSAFGAQTAPCSPMKAGALFLLGTGCMHAAVQCMLCFALRGWTGSWYMYVIEYHGSRRLCSARAEVRWPRIAANGDATVLAVWRGLELTDSFVYVGCCDGWCLRHGTPWVSGDEWYRRSPECDVSTLCTTPAKGMHPGHTVNIIHSPSSPQVPHRTSA
jgi:hypothetical protein